MTEQSSAPVPPVDVKTMTCPTCGQDTKVRMIAQHRTLHCSRCSDYSDKLQGLEIALTLQERHPEAGVLYQLRDEDNLLRLQHLALKHFPGTSFSTATVKRLMGWLMTDHGKTQEQARVTSFKETVELLMNFSTVRLQEDEEIPDPPEQDLVDGPSPPNRLRWQGRSYFVSPPLAWTILFTMWNQSAPVEEAEFCQAVWGDDGGTTGRIKTALHRVNNYLLSLEIPKAIQRKNGYVSWQ